MTGTQHARAPLTCPRCRIPLVGARLAGTEIERCPRCSGMWLDHHELDELEDQAFDVDEWKGTLVFEKAATSLACPRCGAAMKRFRYRYFGLELDFCEQAHGYWLDEGEDQQVLDLMRKTQTAALRTLSAEDRFRRFRQALDHPGFLKRLKRWFRGA